ncbi:MAG: HAMP domain-containing sensor histidine kinase [Chloroflexota bacterium]
MFRSLRARLWLSNVIVVGVALCIVALGLFLYIWRNPALYRQAVIELRLISTELGKRAGQFASLQSNELMDIIKRADEAFEVRVVLLTADGHVRVDSRADTGERLPEVLPTSNPRLRLPTFRDAAGNVWIYALQTVGEGNILMVTRPRPNVPVLTILRDDLLPPLIQAGVVALLLGLILALGISRWIATPMQRIAEAAEGVASGEYQSLHPAGPLEVRTLALAFNQMVERVRAMQQSQRDFVANVSHELKTPLTSVQGFAQALMEGTVDSPEEVQQSAQVIYDEAGRMHRLVNELLELAKFDTGMVEMQRIPLDLEALLSDVREKFAPQAKESQVELVLEVQPLPLLIGDSDRLTQVFSNLLDNALKHTPPGEQVKIRAKPVNASVEVSVQDSGPGIPPEELERVFERFYQLDKSRQSAKNKGVGLGLTIARGIVEAHGGKLEVRSMVGQGSTFVVKLPLALPDDKTPALRRPN